MAHEELPPLNITPGAIRFNTDSMKLEYFRIGMEGGSTSSYAGIGTVAAGEWVQITTDTPDVQTGGTRGVFSGGNPATDVMDYINIATTGNAISFGTLAEAKLSCGATSDRTRGVVIGGYVPSGAANRDTIVRTVLKPGTAAEGTAPAAASVSICFFIQVFDIVRKETAKFGMQGYIYNKHVLK